MMRFDSIACALFFTAPGSDVRTPLIPRANRQIVGLWNLTVPGAGLVHIEVRNIDAAKRVLHLRVALTVHGVARPQEFVLDHDEVAVMQEVMLDEYFCLGLRWRVSSEERPLEAAVMCSMPLVA